MRDEKSNRKVVEARVHPGECMKFSHRVPPAVAMRILLSEKGIKFVDDEKLSFAINTNPEPIGTIEWFEDHKTCELVVRQYIKQEDEE